MLLVFRIRIEGASQVCCGQQTYPVPLPPPTQTRYHAKAVLPKVPVEGKGLAHPESFHQSKTRRVGVRVRLVQVTEYDAPGPLLVDLADPLNRHPSLQDRLQEPARLRGTQSGQDQRMALRQDEIRGHQAVAFVSASLQVARRFIMKGIGSIQKAIKGTGVNEDDVGEMAPARAGSHLLFSLSMASAR